MTPMFSAPLLTVLVTFVAVLAGTSPAAAQSAASPYAGEQARPIKALAPDEQAGLLAGAGLGFAKAAELNSHPGPMHALELADALALTAEQRTKLQALMTAHKARARTLGAELVELERRLDRGFAERRLTPADVDALTAQIGAAQGRLRAEHLNTHLATTALLSAQQVERYDTLRGYRGTSAASAPARSDGTAAGAHRHRH